MSTFEATHVVVLSSRPFNEVVETFEALIGGTPPPEQWDALFHDLVYADASWQEVTQAVGSLIGPSGFLCMLKIDLGSLLSLQGRKKESIRYIIGNPLIANQMIEHNSQAGLYAPLNVLVYQDEGGQTTIAYDLPSSQMRPFGNPSITAVAQMLDTKLAELVAHALGNNA